MDGAPPPCHRQRDQSPGRNSRTQCLVSVLGFSPHVSTLVSGPTELCALQRGKARFGARAGTVPVVFGGLVREQSGRAFLSDGDANALRPHQRGRRFQRESCRHAVALARPKNKAASSRRTPYERIRIGSFWSAAPRRRFFRPRFLLALS